MTLLPTLLLLSVAESFTGWIAVGGLSTESYALTGTDLALKRTLEAFTLTWVCGLGAVIGSFLNVVIHRLPQGMSLNHPKSRCPGCQTPISRRDNLPILGWLLLRGRCRACQMPIPVRYPLVELAVAGIALTLLLTELLTGGANLPVRIPNRTHGNPILWILWYTKWDIVGITLYHASLLTVLLAAWLIARDGFGPPWKLAAPALLLALLVPVVWPDLHPVPNRVPRPDWLAAYRWEVEWTDRIFTPGWPLRIGVGLAGLLDGLAGAVVGALLGRAAGCGIRSEHVQSQLLFGWTLLGTVLGWQASLSAAVLAGVLLVALGLIGRFFGRSRADATPLLGLWVAAGAQILLWNVWDGLPLGIGHEEAFGLRQGWVLAFAVAVSVLAAGAASTRSRQPVTMCTVYAQER